MSEPTGVVDLESAPWFPGMERRASERVPTTLRAVYRLLREDASGRASVRDLSPLGAGLVFPGPVVAGALLHLDFQGESGETICRTLGRIVHVSAEDGGIAGCAFVRELDDATLRLFHAQRLPTTGIDDRRWVRFPCNVETACYASDAAPGEQSPARIVNVSAGGMGLLLPCEFSAGTLLNLDLEGTPAHAAGPVLLRVVRAMARPAGDWLLGCEFARQLSDDLVAALLEAR